MTADDQGYVQLFKDRQEALFRRKASKDLRVASRSGVAEQHLAQPGNLQAKRCGPRRHQPLVSRTRLLRRPAHDLSKLLRNGARLDARSLGKHLTVTIALDELDWNVEVQQAGE